MGDPRQRTGDGRAASRPYDVVTFDCYGTLIDWEEGIARAFSEAASEDGVSLAPTAVLAAHAEIEPGVQAGEYRSYRAVLAETALGVARRLGLPLDPARAGFLAESLPTWRPFPDTVPALVKLQASGYRLGILSNVDDDLLAATLLHLGVRFDLVVTAEGVRRYKPDPAHFLEARSRIGAARWLHAARSLFHDVRPATELRIPVAWIRRGGERKAGDPTPDYEFPTLEALAATLA